ncbi:response regulator transcription factor [Kineococcus rhizosphaerae]|uniref:LuxR family two component transcriptional regulator n=1 Tax=Kineococcus rhizosphaerae TaxID=559628 RepID=A0A2T0R1P9_9ACTN|nr:response regulator transcription factor [Kineococcus rhizosphaerae]PRY13435.1 LuxR family two component transcriptional regulator [Kineococcus rhizosphaerae]
MPALRVVVADDQTIVRDGLVALLDLLPDVEVVATAADGAQAVARVAEHAPDVVLMDLGMPSVDGVEATRRITAQHPDTAVVVLTTYADDASILGALQAGARGYLTKSAGRADIARALQAAAARQVLLDADVQARLLSAAANPAPPAPVELPDGLTEREADVLRLIARGRSNSEIARELVVSVATVKTHVNHLFAKTASRDRAQAVAYAHAHGLV